MTCFDDTSGAQEARRAALLAEVAPARATAPLPAHGSRSRYTHHACRCLPCRRAEARYQKARALRLAQERKAP